MEFKDLQKLLPTVTEKSIPTKAVDVRGEPIETRIDEGLVELLRKAETLKMIIDDFPPFE